MKKLMLFLFAFWMFTCIHAQQGILQLPATGQITSYYPGDDGDLQMGVPLPENRFTDHGDGSATDQLTGLMWVTDGNLIVSRDPDFDQDRTPGDGDINWKTALDYIQKLNDENYLGYTDWRMPNYLELLSLVNLSFQQIALPADHPFDNLKEGYYSSTTNDRLRAYAVVVYLQQFVVHANLTYPPGHWESLAKNLDAYSVIYHELYLFPVRDDSGNGNVYIPKTGQHIRFYDGDDGYTNRGTAWPSPRLTDNNDGTVTDRLTGLVWTRDSHILFTRDPDFDTIGVLNGSVPWTMALDYIAKLNTENFLGFNDWRLPNRNELASLIDYSRNEPCIPKNNPFITTYYDATPAEFTYWSSTTVADSPDSIWCFSFGLSNLYTDDKTAERAVWPVRTCNNALPSGSIHGIFEGDDIPLKGVEITLEGPVKGRTETDTDGYYEFTGLPDGTYTVAPGYEYFTFTPTDKMVIISGTAVECNFNAAYNQAYGWTDISANLFPIYDFYSAGLNFVFFVTDDEGWVSSSQDIYHTTDGGQTFEKQILPIDGDWATAIYMFDQNNGYAGSSSGWIYKTENGGDEWSMVALTGNWVLDIDFPPGSTTGYCSGANGSLWEISPAGVEQIVTGSNLDLRISALDVGNLFIGASPHRLWHYDGNEIVDCCTMGGGSGGIHFHNDTLGWVSKAYGGIDGSGGIGIYNCIDLKPDNDTIQYHFTDVHSPNGKDVWVVGSSGAIWYSPNGNDFFIDPPESENNTTWYPQAAGLTKEYLTTVNFTSLTNGYACGSNGILLKYSTLPGAPEGADILGIQLRGQVGSAEIDNENLTIYAEVDPSEDITRIIPEIYTSAGASCDPPSGLKQDFSSPVVYHITSADGAIEKDWTLTVTYGSGFKEIDLHEMVVYPNPTKGLLNIQFPGQQHVDFKSMDIIDIYGKAVKSISPECLLSHCEVDVSYLPPGIYFIHFVSGDYSITQKIIIQN